jgi:predicted Zn-dependent peptidase
VPPTAGARWVRNPPLGALALLLPASLPPHGHAQTGPTGGTPGNPPAEFSRDLLPGGLAVLVEERPGSGLVALEIGVLAGARFEGPDTASAAQFLEQLLQDGTTTRPTRRDIQRAITSRGGDLGVSAGWELVRLTVEVASEDFGLALDVLADMLLNSTFSPERVETERELILQNLLEREDTPSDLLYDVAQATALGDPDLHHLPSGTVDGVAALTRDALLRYRDSQITAGNTIVAVAGDVRRADVLPRVQQALAGLPTGARQEPRPLPTQPPPRLVERPAGSEQSNIAIAVRTPGVRSELRPALVVLSGILGGGGQRLYEEIRDRRGLAYGTGTSFVQMRDAGVLVAQAGTQPDNAAEVVGLLRQELERLRDEPPTAEEVATSIAYTVDGQIVSLETNSARARDLARREALYGVAPPRAEFLNQIRAVRPADIQETARRALESAQLITVVLRPEDE